MVNSKKLPGDFVFFGIDIKKQAATGSGKLSNSMTSVKYVFFADSGSLSDLTLRVDIFQN